METHISEGTDFLQNINALRCVNARLFTLVLDLFLSLSLSLFTFLLAGLYFGRSVEYPQLFQSFHLNLGMATGENDASLVAFPLCHNLSFAFQSKKHCEQFVGNGIYIRMIS